MTISRGILADSRFPAQGDSDTRHPFNWRSRIRRGVHAGVAIGALLFAGGVSGETPLTYFVAPNGRDTWSGRLPNANAEGTDGPFPSITRARDAIRALKAAAPIERPVTVQIRGGNYYLEEPIVFGPEDSGSEQGPISYVAYPGERPEFVGGRRLTGYRTAKAGQIAFDLPELKSGPWDFRSLFVDGRREIRARYPNFDASDPYRKGFLYAASGPQESGFGIAVGNIHSVGDWLEYRVNVPVEGDYRFWMLYGALNKTYGNASMDDRCAIRVDGGAPIRLRDLADTGGWTPTRWGQGAKLRLSAGKHLLRWENLQGGGLALDAFALCDDPQWRPGSSTLSAFRSNGHLVMVRAADFLRSSANRLTVSASGEGSRTSIYGQPGAFKGSWIEAPEAELHIFPSGDCRAFKEILFIKAFDAASRRISLAGKEAQATLNVGDRYFIENVYEELDSPGEWYLRKAPATLHYQPRAGFSEKSEVVVPRLTRIIQVEGGPRGINPVRNLRFAGLVFRDTDWNLGGGSPGFGMGGDGVVYFRNAEKCVIEECRFHDIGPYAVCLEEGNGNAVRECDISHAGGGGVLIIEGRGHTITENHIHHIGEAYKHIGGVVLLGARAAENCISHNAIHDSSRYGISLKHAGPGNVIEFNRIQNTNLETSDTGGIEVTQEDRNHRSGSVIQNNLVADTIGYSSCAGKPSFLSWGIYLDSFASGYTVSGNVVVRTWNGGIMLQGGRENKVTNNIFVDGQTYQGTIANFADNARGLLLTNNIFAFGTPGAFLFAAGALRKEIIRIDHNLYFGPGGLPPATGWGGTLSFEAWRKQGWDLNSRVADPRFTDPKRGIYSLAADSPAFKLGFKALDLRQIGPQKNKCDCRVLPAGPTFWERH